MNPFERLRHAERSLPSLSGGNLCCGGWFAGAQAWPGMIRPSCAVADEKYEATEVLRDGAVPGNLVVEALQPGEDIGREGIGFSH